MGYLDRRVSGNWVSYAWIGILVVPYLTYIPQKLYWEVPKYAKYALFGHRVWVYACGIWEWYVWIGIQLIPYLTFIPLILFWEVLKYAK